MPPTLSSSRPWGEATSATVPRFRLRKRFYSALAAVVATGAIAACEKRDPVADEADAVLAELATSNGAGPLTGGPPAPNVVDNSPGPIPAAIRGRWGLTPADCTSTRGDAKGLLEIGPDTLKCSE